MHMQAMNNFGNRGFGGPPQPQRQGGRRGNNRGGFRTSRFDQQGSNNQNNQRNGPNQGGQRPMENQQKPPLQQQKPPQQSPQQQQNKPPQQITPQPTKTTPPVQTQQTKPVTPATPQNKAVQQPASKPPQTGPQPTPQLSQQPKSVQPAAANAKRESGPANKDQDVKPNESGNQQNGSFGGNKPSNWNHGGNKGTHVGNQGAHGGNQGGHGGNQSGHGGNQGGHGGNQGNFGGNQGVHSGNQGGHGGNQGGHGGNLGSHGGNQRGHDGNQGGHGGNQRGQDGNQGGNNPRNSFHQKPGGGPGGPARNQMRNTNQRGGPQDNLGGPKTGPREEQMLQHKLKELSGPLHDLPPVDQSEVKFNGRSRLYIGNVASEVTEEDVQQLFNQFGETSELFLNKDKNFGFIKLDYRVNAEKAKRDLDGTVKFGRPLRVRFAPHNSAIRVKNLPQFVSNELLYKSFEIFGKIEKAYVKVDERGKTLGEGVVEFQRKPAAQAAIRNCNDKCYFLTSSLRPVIVENYEEPDESDGYPEKNLPKKHPEFMRARECGPRFSESGSFEHEYGTRWKQLYDMHRQKEDALKSELQAEEEKLEAQMEFARYEHETEVLREQLRQREQDRERKKRSWELAERQADERRDTERASLMRQGDELAQRMRMQDDELRRRQQENTLFVQTQRLNALLNRGGQENDMYDGHSNQQPMDGGFREPFEMGRGYDAGMQKNHAWEGPRQVDDFPNKRRRF